MRRLSWLALPLWFLPGLLPAANPYFELGERGPLAEKALQAARKQVREYRETKVIEDPGLAPFHRREPRRQTSRRPLCEACHPALPHRRSPRTRSFLNMHTAYVACETCHFQPRGMTFGYRWLAYGEKGARERTAQENAAQMAAAAGKGEGGGDVPSIVPDAVSRLAPFVAGSPALLFLDDPATAPIRQTWKSGSDADKTRLKARLHRSLKKDGRGCSDCHSRRQTLLDWARLGASERQARAIEENAVARFFSRYRKKDQRLRLTELLR